MRRLPRTWPTRESLRCSSISRDMAREGLKRARALKPDPFFTPEAASLVELGGFDTDLRSPRRPSIWLSKRSSNSRTSSGHCSNASTRSASGETIVSSNTSGIPIAVARRRPERRLSPPLARHALLQPAAVSAPPRNHSDAGDRSVGRRAGVPLRGCPSRQRRRHREGPAELHRQSHRALLHRAGPEGARIRRVHHRGNRRHDWTGARPAQERHVPDDGHRRARRHQPRRRTTFRCRFRPSSSRSSIAAGSARRPARDSTSGAGSEILVLDPATFTYRPKQPVQSPALEATRNIEDPSRADEGSVSRSGQGWRLSSGHAWSDAAPYRRRRVRYRLFDRRRRSRHAVGIRLGAGALRDLGRDRRATRCSTAMQTASGSRRPGVGPEDSRRRRQSIPARRPSAGRAGSADSQSGQGSRAASSGAMPAPASSISTTACSPSSSIRR